MKKASYVIGLDIGTTSAKSVVFTKSGEVISEAEAGYPVTHPHPGWAEQDPLEIEQAAFRAVRESLEKKRIPAEAVHSVGLSAAMHALICVDEKTEPLSPVIIWADGRSRSQAESWKASPEGRAMYLATGTPIHPMSPLLKLIWMKDTGYEPYRKAERFLSVKEFLTARWFGIHAVDYSIASATGMFDIRRKTWHAPALAACGISEEQLSPPVSPLYQFSPLHADAAEKLGLSRDTPFTAGGSDGPLANLGIGAVTPGSTAVTIGTSGAIRQMSAAPQTDEKQEVFCYAFSEDRWILGGPTNNGGNVLQWLQGIYGNHSDVSGILKEAEKAPAGSDGLLFLPHLNGERAPHWDAAARGAYVGLAADHERHHMLRAGLEGTLFSIYHVGEALSRLTGENAVLYASGGFARSPFWVQLLADIFEETVHLPESHQSSAWGAAWTSLTASGETDGLDAVAGSIPMGTPVHPDAASSAVYRQLFHTYKHLYDALKPAFHELHAFRNQ
ncbi:gluconokinase [Alkalicoccus urumqiensis]|uniref:Gluconate kinase n=1 Tax=Alkalicoccus urumqiensis TaxID=1548213 RepID=A0A2P6MJ56_ALKUR|nr:gluconokinase [Alkalicoccus urumqiensis]PRO66306.1 gluconate kinase [Alkalicoccus urumqiensis]